VKLYHGLWIWRGSGFFTEKPAVWFLHCVRVHLLPFWCISSVCETKLDIHLLRSNAEGVEYKTRLTDQESDATTPKDRMLYYFSC
jgi:hypothetical protein